MGNVKDIAGLIVNSKFSISIWKSSLPFTDPHL